MALELVPKRHSLSFSLPVTGDLQKLKVSEYQSIDSARDTAEGVR